MARQAPGGRRRVVIGAVLVVALLAGAVAVAHWSLGDEVDDASATAASAAHEPAVVFGAPPGGDGEPGSVSAVRGRKRAEQAATGPADPRRVAPGSPATRSAGSPESAAECVYRVALADRERRTSAGAGPVEIAVSIGAKTERTLDGMVRFADLPPGDYDVTTSAPGYVTLREVVRLPRQDERRTVLRPAVQFTVRVKTADGVVVRDAPVTVIPSEPATAQPPVRGRTSQDGIVVFDTVPAGRASVWVHTGFAAGNATSRVVRTKVEIADGGSLDVVAFADVGQEIRGTVVDAAGAPIVGARVVVMQNGATPRMIFPDAETGPDGRFVVGVPGLIGHDLYVLPPEGPSPLVPSVARGTRKGADIRVTLEVGAVLAGTLVDEAGRPIPRRLLEFAPAPGVTIPDMRVRTDDEGRFRVEGLVPTTYTLQPVTLWSGETRALLHSSGSPSVGSVTAPNEIMQVVALDRGDVRLKFVNTAGDGATVHFTLRMVDREGRTDAPFVMAASCKGAVELPGLLPLGVYEVVRRSQPTPGQQPVADTVLGTVRCVPPDAATSRAEPTTFTVPD